MAEVPERRTIMYCDDCLAKEQCTEERVYRKEKPDCCMGRLICNHQGRCNVADMCEVYASTVVVIMEENHAL